MKMNKDTANYTKFELIKHYLTLYKMYRLLRKEEKYEKLAKKYHHKYETLQLAYLAGFETSKKFFNYLNALNSKIELMKKMVGPVESEVGKIIIAKAKADIFESSPPSPPPVREIIEGKSNKLHQRGKK